jgi:hypothetical protein
MESTVLIEERRGEEKRRRPYKIICKSLIMLVSM